MATLQNPSSICTNDEGFSLSPPNVLFYHLHSKAAIFVPPIVVVDERGNSLPPTQKGGEKMCMESYEVSVQHRFDWYCKTVIQNEARNGIRKRIRTKETEIALVPVLEDSMETMSVLDAYPSHNTVFEVDSETIYIKNELLAQALLRLSENERNLVLWYYILGMRDYMIANRLNIPRRTASSQRKKAYEQLKRLMGGDSDGHATIE